MSYRPIPLKTVAVAVIVMAVTTTVVSALTTFTRDVGGSVTVEAIGADGKVIEGFSKDDCEPITSDSVRHILKWKGSEDCQLIQARPIKLRFYLTKAKLYSFTPRIRHEHYIQSYD